jgi:hypothetical protein
MSEPQTNQQRMPSGATGSLPASASRPSRRWLTTICAAISFVLIATSSARAAPADDFLVAWTDAADQPTNAATIWQDFIKANPADDLAQAAQLKLALAMWSRDAKPADILPHLQITAPQQGTPSEFRTLLIAAGDALEARLRMQQIAEALRQYHAKHIEYPQSLDVLVTAGLLDKALLTDPFGQPWAYEATARRAAPDLPRQRYTLACSTIKRSSRDVAADIERAGDDVSEGYVSSVVPGQQQVFAKWYNKDGSEGPSQSWTVGKLANRYTLWYVHSRYILVGDAGIPKLMRVR